MNVSKEQKRVVTDMRSLQSLIPKAEAVAMQAAAVASPPKNRVEVLPEKKVPETQLDAGNQKPAQEPPPTQNQVKPPQLGHRPVSSAKPPTTRAKPLEKTAPKPAEEAKKPETGNSVKGNAPSASASTSVSAKKASVPNPTPSTAVQPELKTMSTPTKKASAAKAPATPAPIQMQAAKLNVYLLLSLDFTSLVIQENLSSLKGLSKFKLEGSETPINLFNPFRGLSAKDKDKGLGRGILRTVLPKAFDLAGEINDSNMMLLGNTDITAQHLQDVGRMLEAQLESAIGIPPETLVAVYSTDESSEEGSEEPATTEGLLRKDLISVNHWINSSGPENGEGFTHNLILNLRVRCPHFHNSEDPGAVVSSIQQTVSNIVDARLNAEKTVSPIILGLMLKASDVVDPGFYEMLGVLNDAENGNWVCYDRPDLYELCGAIDCDWLPPTAKQIDEQLLVPRSGMLYIATFPEDSEEDEEGEAGEGSDDDEG